MRIINHAKRIYLSPLSEKRAIFLENRGSSGVYALICKVNNKFYVGSSINLTNRLLDYMQPAYLAQLVKRPILKALRKYGANNWIFIVLETCQASVVLEREQYWLDLLEPEYNLSPSAGSTLGIVLSEETKAKISAARKGQIASEETRLFMSETRRGSNNPMFGKILSEETRAKMSAAKQGALHPHFGKIRSTKTVDLMRKNHPHTKAIFQYASDQMTFIAKFDSVRQARLLTLQIYLEDTSVGVLL